MIIKPITDQTLLDHLASITRDGIDRFLLADGTIRLALIHGTTLVNHARSNHGLSLPEALVLSEALLVTALTATNLKETERISLLLESDGPTAGFVTDVNTAGQVRGYLRRRLEDGDGDPPVEPDQAYRILGTGSLDVVRSDTRKSDVSRGRVEWHQESVASNIERYYRVSEQIATLVRTFIAGDEAGRILGAAAVHLQRLPGANQQQFENLEAAIDSVGDLAVELAQGNTPTEIVRNVFSRWNPSLVSTHNADFYCDCSKDRFSRFLNALPREEAEDILKNGPFPLRTICHNCSSEYVFTRDELQEILTQSGTE